MCSALSVLQCGIHKTCLQNVKDAMFLDWNYVKIWSSHCIILSHILVLYVEILLKTFHSKFSQQTFECNAVQRNEIPYIADKQTLVKA